MTDVSAAALIAKLLKRDPMKLGNATVVDLPFLTVPERDRIIEALRTAALPHLQAQEPLAEFARWALAEGPFDGVDLDGSSVQDKAEKLGLIIRTKYDPAIHGESAECVRGDDWFVFSPLIAETTRGEVMCDCHAQIDGKLKEHNGRLATGFTFHRAGQADLCLLMQVEKIDTKIRKKPPHIIPTFCPFCGTALTSQDQTRRSALQSQERG